MLCKLIYMTEKQNKKWAQTSCPVAMSMAVYTVPDALKT